MRDYVTGYFGEYREDSVTFNIHLRLKIWRQYEWQFDQAVDQLDQDIKDAGGDWTGSLVFKQRTHFKFGKGWIHEFLMYARHGTSLPSGFDLFDFIDAQMDTENIRSQGYNSESEA